MIRFPKMHIATSVVNRILNAADDLEPPRAAPVPHAPAVPDPTAEGAAIDRALASPPGPVPPIDQAPGAARELLTGGTALDGIIEGE